jgi:hypothetical protein
VSEVWKRPHDVVDQGPVKQPVLAAAIAIEHLIVPSVLAAEFLAYSPPLPTISSMHRSPLHNFLAALLDPHCAMAVLTSCSSDRDCFHVLWETVKVQFFHRAA